MAATATTCAVVPLDRETLWKMHVHRAIDNLAFPIVRPRDPPTSSSSGGESGSTTNMIGDDDGGSDQDDAFVAIAMAVFADRGIRHARLLCAMAPTTTDAYQSPCAQHQSGSDSASVYFGSGRSDRPSHRTRANDDDSSPSGQALRRGLYGSSTQTHRPLPPTNAALRSNPMLLRNGPSARPMRNKGFIAGEASDRSTLWTALKGLFLAAIATAPLAMAFCVQGD